MVTQTTKIKKLRRRQLDQMFERFQPLTTELRAKKEWLKEIRLALGITTIQFAKLLNISAPAYVSLEASEKKQTIELQTLHRIAEAVGCKVVYAIVPDRDSGGLESILQKRAYKVAEKFVSKISKTMALEEQALEKKEQEFQVQELANELISTLDKKIWNPIR